MKYLGQPLRERGGAGQLSRINRELNRLREIVRSMMPSKAPGIRTTHTAFGIARTILVRPRPQEGGATIKQFRIKQILDDYFVCREFDGSEETGENVNVAKAWELRKSSTNNLVFGITLEPYPGSPGIAQIAYSFPNSQVPSYRIASMGTATEHQVIIEHYLVDRTVVFAAESENGTGISAADEWQDLNVGGHAWARVV